VETRGKRLARSKWFLNLRAFSKEMWKSAQRLLFHISDSFHSALRDAGRGGIVKYWATTGRAYSLA